MDRQTSYISKNLHLILILSLSFITDLKKGGRSQFDCVVLCVFVLYAISSTFANTGDFISTAKGTSDTIMLKITTITLLEWFAHRFS